MANLDAAFGLRPYRKLGSDSNNHGVQTMLIQTASTSGSANKIYQGSPVIPLVNGMIDIVGNDNGGTVPLLGVFLGCNYVALDGTPKWSASWPGTASVKAGTVATASVMTDPNALYVINCDAACGDLHIHTNANFANATKGNDVTGISTAELAVSTVEDTNTLNLRIVGFEDSPGNEDASAAGRHAIVMLNVHFYRSTTGVHD